MKQTTNTILMIRPISFRMNEQTAVNNYYQKEVTKTLPETINSRAQKEFDDYVKKLRNHGINVIVVSDTEEYDTPDSIFPNTIFPWSLYLSNNGIRKNGLAFFSILGKLSKVSNKESP